MSFIYLASPYTPHHGESIKERVDSVCKVAAALMERGYNIFSPIVHSHYIADHLDEARRLDHEFWMKQDLAILASAYKLMVLMLPGWQESEGVAREIAFAERLDIPIVFIDKEILNDDQNVSDSRLPRWVRMGLGV